MKSLFNRQAERFVRERKRYKRWVALFLCLAMVVSSVTYTSLTREGRALDESTESQTDGADAAVVTSGAGADVTITQGGGGSSDGNSIQTDGSGAGTDADGAAGADASGTGETGTGTSASGTNGSGAAGTENPAGGKDGQQNSALNGNDTSGGTDTGAENGGTNEDPDKAPGTETPGQEDPKDPTAGMEDQENSEETEGETLTEEEQAAVDEVVALFGALPDSETVKENFKGFQDAEEEEGFEAYKTQVCDQIKEAKEAYDALSDAQKQAVNKAIAEAEGDNANAESILGQLDWVQDHAYTMEPPVFELMDLAAYGSMRNMLYAYAMTYAAEGGLQEQINEVSENGGGEVDLYVTADTQPENLVILDDVEVTLQLDEGAALSPAGQIYNGSLSTITVFGELIVEGSGKITSNGVKDARGITVADGGRLTMNSGTIEGFNVEGNGGGILVENKGTCVINGGTFKGNTAKYYGGGLFGYDAASVTVNGGTWTGNTAENGGGIAFNKATGSSCVLKNITVSGNTATQKGGGFYVEDAVKGMSLESTTIENNTAKVGGGMYFVNGADLTLPENGGVEIKGNHTTAGNGGGIWLGQDSQFTMTEGNTISNNNAEGVKNGTKGGGIYMARRSTFTMTGGMISGNHALTHGGGVALDSENNYRSSFFMSGGTIQENSVGQADNAQSAMYGGGVFINSYSDKVEISGENTLITKNTGASSGGGICISGSGNGFTLKEATISYNEAKPNNLDSYGGGISCSTIATIESGIIEHNNASYGGGVSFSSVTMKGGEIRENSASGYDGGGGMRTTNLTMEGGRIHNNTSPGYGGGVRCGNLLMEDGEIDHNTSSSYGGGVFCWDGTYATINGGSIHDNTNKGPGGGLATNRLFTMTGGKIYGNSTTSEGGGVYINRNAVHTMTDGKIYGNTSAGNGGGVACRYGLFQMSGGEIYENRSTGNWGGGICSWGDSNNWKGKVLEISGDAVIRDNTAGTGGGGVCVDYGSGLVKGGSITGNMTAGHGGGIAANSVTTELTITGGVLKDNMAAKYGNDIRVSGTYVSYKDRTHYTICSAREMTGASAESCWIDEIAEESDDDWRLTGEIDNQSILDEYIQKEEKDGVLVETAESQKWFRYGAYTFSEKTAAAVASVDENTYGSVQEAVDAIAGSAQKNENKTIIMLADSRETVIIPGGVTATLNLAGHTLKGEVGSVIEVKEDANLTIMDSSAAEGKEGTGIIRGGSGKKIKSTDNVVRTYGGGLYIAGTVTLESGSIRNNTADYGAVYVSKNGTFNMKGGAVENNTGRGVYVYCYNEAGTAGVTAKFNLSGGKICKNTGGGVAIHNNNVKGPEMVMSGGEISDHTANVEGVGIYNCAGKFTMSNGKISNNKSSSNGGGIYAVYGNSAVTINGGEISGNKAANGGGIRGNGAPLTISGGVIKANTATTGGGIYKNDGSTFKMTGGEISDNTATTGGGVYLWNTTMQANGGVIKENKASYGGAIQASSSYGNINMINMDEDSTIVITGNEASVAGGGIRYNTSSNNISFTMKKGAVYGNKTNLRPSDLYLTKNTIIKELYPAKDMDAADKDGKKYTGWYDYASSQLFVDVTSLKGEKVARTYDLAASTGVTTGTGICRIIGGSTSQGTSVSAGEPGTEVLYDSLAKAIGEVEKRREADSDTADSLVIQLLENIPADYEESVTIPEGMEVTIDLNGNTLKPELKDYTFDVHNGSVLNLKNGTLSGEGMANARGIRVLGGDAESTVSKLNAENVTIQNFNTADNGGGIYATGYWGIDLDSIVIENCTAGQNGGGIYARRSGQYYVGDFTMKDSRVENCRAKEYGGGVYVFVDYAASDYDKYGIRQIIFDHCEIKNNTAENGNGGGVHVEVRDAWRHVGLTVKGNTVIEGNKAKGAAGLSSNRMYQVDLSDTEICRNETTNGGSSGLWIQNDTYTRKITLKNVNVHHNTAYGGGCGGAYIRGTIDISDSFFNDNEVVTRNDCGGLQVDGAATIQDTEICRNSARDMGGLYINNRNVTESVYLKNVLVDNNYARNNYGGIDITQHTAVATTVDEKTVYTGRSFVFEDCTISNNECGNGNGGGIGFHYAYFATIDFIRTTISGNRSSRTGGGVWFGRDWSTGSTITLKKDTVIEENSASAGGGIFFDGCYGSRQILCIEDGAKIQNNTAAGSGGGIYARIADIEMTGGEITGNTANYGGGIAFEAHGWGSDNNTVVNYRNARFNMTGGRISGNTARIDGGGLHLGEYCGGEITNVNKISATNHGDPIIVSGGEITGNSAGRWGGGVAESSRSAHFQLEEDGKVYDNSAALAQDIYGHYVRGYEPARLSLIPAADMFDADDAAGRSGIGWLDETMNRVIKDEITGELKTRYYALTLLYDNGKPVAEINGTSYSSVQEAVNAIQSGTYQDIEGIPVVKMVADSVENVEIPNGVEMVLNLNGKTLQGHSTAISCAGKLTIRDEKDSDVTSTGTITGFGVEAGGGVHVLRNGSVTMESGQIANCYGGTGYTSSNDGTKGGAAVAVDAGTFLLTGGSLNNNSANCGAAVLVRDAAGKFRMTGGLIEKNTGNYGAVYVTKGSAEITGGELRENRMTEQGGAVYLKAGSLIIRGTTENGVKIAENEAAGRGGGGIFVYGGTANLKNVEISGNKATREKNADVSLGAGGGIYVYGGRLNIGEGTTIANNNAVRGGGIYQTSGTIHMVGGKIWKNTAQMGGGVAQYPIQKAVFVLMKGGVFDNLSKLSSSGNDFYSRYEGDQDYYNDNYRGKGNIPALTVINADAMGNPNYNVWRDDTYTVYKNDTDEAGNSLYKRLGNEIGEGQYVKADIKVAYNVELTAAHYDTEAIETDLLTGKEVGELKLGPRITDEKEVEKTTTGTAGFDSTAGAGEKTAAQKMAEDAASWSEEDGYIRYVGADEKYKGDHGNGEALYEPEQMADWESGNDSTAANTLVRTFDTVNYPFVITIVDSKKVPDVSSGNPGVTDNDESAGSNPGVSDNDKNAESNPGVTDNAANNAGSNPGAADNAANNAGSSPEVDEDAFYRVWFEATLPTGADEAEFILTEGAPSDMTHYTVEPVGDTMQILSGYWDVPATDYISGGTLSKSVKIRVNGMHDGETLKPEFECWMTGSEKVKKEAQSERLTVSAAAKYNVTLDYHEKLSYSGYFNVVTGEEASEKDAEDNPDEVKYGTILGYGVTAELYNDGTEKGIKGIEVPADGMQFDLRFKGSLYMDGNPVKDSAGQPVTAAPYIWAYKENAKGDYGKEPGSTDTRNMNWNDEDDLPADQNTDYAYNAAPFNSGGGESSCYNGGSWKLDTPATNGDETVVHATLSGYSVNYNDTNPSRASNGSQSGTLGSLIKNSYVKPFSAGYVQIFYPVDEERVRTNGYLTIAMEAAVTGTQVQSSSGQPAVSGNAAADDQDNLKLYFGKDHLESLDDGIATGEVYYKDNYSNHQFGMYVFKGDGTPASYVGKTNYFLTSTREQLSGQEGSASTPLMSLVYIGGTMNYSSRPIRTDDKDGQDKDYYIPEDQYNTQSDNKTEYEYLTALNILQKFDAEAYTPVGYAEPVINKNYNFDDRIDGKALSGFHITNSETGTSWSSTKTRNAKLTILYAAKVDGSNWDSSVPIDDESFHYGDNGDKDRTYNDGGVRDMDAHREGDLIYFATLDDLYRYFGGKDEDGNYKGKCVAILYELRDCCIRSGRSVSASAGMQVGNALALTGNTYCTTNDARGWTNYRPTYKEYFTNYYGSKDEEVRNKFFELLHNETLETTSGVAVEENGVTVYKPMNAISDAGDQEGSEGETEVKKDVRLQTLPAAVDFWNGYIKTQYVNGKKVGGTHNGWMSGNTLLIKTLDPNILINGKDTIKGSGGLSGERIKESYNVSKGERIAKFEVIPSLSAAQGLDKHFLVSTGVLSTGIKIDITLPAKMAYVNKSITYDYTKSDYSEGELDWKEVEVETVGETTVLHLYTNITDLTKKLPRINFETFLGTTNIAEAEQKDVKDGQVLTLNAGITPVYERKDQNQMAAKTNYDKCSIIIEKDGNNGGYVTVDKRVTEVGEDLVYNLNYRSGSDESNIELMSILPYNGDGRDTQFNGGYRVARIEVTFSEQADYEAYLNGVASETDEGLGLEPGKLSYLTGQVVPGQKLTDASAVRTEADIRTDLRQSGNVLAKEAQGEKQWTVTYLIGGTDAANLVQTDAQKNGIGLYAKIPKLTHNKGVMVKVTLSPKTANANEQDKLRQQLIQGNNSAVQGGGNLYGEDFFFSSADTIVPASKDMIQTVKRSVSGRIWMDQKHDGVYEAGNASNPNDDRVIKEMAVKLYRVKQVNGTTTYEAAENVYGDNISTVNTNASGRYLFENLAPGEYQVVLQDIDKNYKIANKTGKTGDIAPISFGRLSVTTLGNVAVRTANASYVRPYYEEQDSEAKPAKLKAVYLAGNINLPTADSMSTAEYVSGNWNAGLYYLDQTIVKNWNNMTKYDQDKEYGAGFVITGTYENSSGTVTDGSVAEGGRDAYALTYVMSGKGAAPNTVTIESTGTANTIYSDGRTSGADESRNYTKFTKSVTPAPLPEGGTQTYTWTLENLALQAEGRSGRITYTVEESKAFEKKAGVLRLLSSEEGLNGFITETDTAGSGTTVRSYTADNTQVLYEVNVKKIGEQVDATGIDTENFIKWLGEEGDVTQPGTKFGIYSDSKCETLLKEVGPETNSAISSFVSMPAGTYYVKETNPPLFYKLNPAVFKLEITYPQKAEGEKLKPSATAIPTVTLTQEGKAGAEVLTAEGTALTAKGEAKNYKVGFDVKDDPVLGTIKVHKVDSEGKDLANVTFKLTCSDRGSEKEFRVINDSGASVTVNEITRTTDAKGALSFEGLTPGTYILTETGNNSSDKMLLTEPVTITVPLKMSKAEAEKQQLRTTGEDVVILNNMCYFYSLNYEISNEAVLKLPETGGTVGVIPIVAAALILMAGGYFAIRRKKKEQEENEGNA